MVAGGELNLSKKILTVSAPAVSCISQYKNQMCFFLVMRFVCINQETFLPYTRPKSIAGAAHCLGQVTEYMKYFTTIVFCFAFN